MRHADGSERLGQRADLVDLHQDRIRRALLYPVPKPCGVGHEQVVPDKLYTIAKGLGQRTPALPVIFGKPVLDRDDRINLAEVVVVKNHFIR